MSTLRIALAKGRMFDLALERFTRAGITLAGDAGRKLLIPSSDPAIEFLAVKPGDVPIYVESG
ncbi:MAG: ATP phosphoribosyltransferase, partial [Gemmatimonadales bacterium]